MTTATPSFVTRAPVTAAVLERAATGSSTVLTGPRGAGLTHALHDAAGAFGRAHRRVTVLTATPLTRRTPFGAFLGLLGREDLHRLGRADPLGRGLQLRSAVLALDLDVLAIDDLPLLDAESVALLADLAARGTTVIATASTADLPSPLVDAFVAARGAAVVDLPPLTAEECAALAAELLGGPVDAELDAVLARWSDRRPGPLRDAVDAGRAAGAIEQRDGLWLLGAPLPAPPALRERVVRRFLALPKDERGWIAAVAVAGAVSPDMAARIAVPAVIAATAQAGWTTTDEDGTVPSHDAEAAAVVEALGPGARRTVLERLLAALAAVGRRPTLAERVAAAGWRLELGERIDPEEAIELAVHAASGPGERLLRFAVEEGGGTPARVALAELLKRTRRAELAIEVVRAATAHDVPEEERADLARVRAISLGMAERRPADALEELDAHLAAHPATPELLVVRAGLLAFEARPADTRAVLESVPEPSGFALAYGLTQEALLGAETGDLEAGLDAAARFGAMADPSVPGYRESADIAQWLVAELRSVVALDLAEASAIARPGFDRSVEEHRPDARPPFATVLARVARLDGRPAEAVRLLREAEAGIGSWRDSSLIRVLAELAAALVAAGELTEAGRVLDRIGSTDVPPLHRGRADLAQAELLAARGDRASAAALAGAVHERALGLGLVVEAFDAADAALRHGDAAAAGRLLALGALPAGPVRDLQREHARAALAEDVPALADVATRLWAAGLRSTAVELAARLPASAGLEGRLAGWLAQLPELPSPDVPVVLTQREREAVLLAASGLPDRAIALRLGIALRTAQTHIGRAYGKLGVHRRGDLREYLGLD